MEEARYVEVAKGKGHTREGPEQHHMLRPHKRATPIQRAAPPEC